MSVGEAPSNWLSVIIAEKRRDIQRLIPAREQKAERDAIVSAIKSHRDGAALAKKPELEEVVFLSLAVANNVEREALRNPTIMTASPAIQASWFVFDELDLDRPTA